MATDYVFASKDYIRDNLGYQDATSFLQAEFNASQIVEGVQLKAVICPWGADGVYFLRLDSEPVVQRILTKSLDHVVESIGAGDTFIGASVAALSSNVALTAALQLACEIATEKCLNVGFEFASDKRGKWLDAIHMTQDSEEACSGYEYPHAACTPRSCSVLQSTVQGGA